MQLEVSRLTSVFNISYVSETIENIFIHTPKKSDTFNFLTGTALFLTTEVESEAQSTELSLSKPEIQMRDSAKYIQKRRTERQTVSICRSV